MTASEELQKCPVCRSPLSGIPLPWEHREWCALYRERRGPDPGEQRKRWNQRHLGEGVAAAAGHTEPVCYSKWFSIESVGLERFIYRVTPSGVRTIGRMSRWNRGEGLVVEVEWWDGEGFIREDAFTSVTEAEDRVTTEAPKRLEDVDPDDGEIITALDASIDLHEKASGALPDHLGDEHRKVLTGLRRLRSLIVSMSSDDRECESCGKPLSEHRIELLRERWVCDDGYESRAVPQSAQDRREEAEWPEPLGPSEKHDHVDLESPAPSPGLIRETSFGRMLSIPWAGDDPAVEILTFEGEGKDHTHDYWEHAILMDGPSDIIIDGRVIEAVRGKVYSVPPGTPHRMRPRTWKECHWLLWYSSDPRWVWGETAESGDPIPCPFCGDPWSVGVAMKKGHDGPEEWARCGSCGGRAPLTTWNRRTEAERAGGEEQGESFIYLEGDGETAHCGKCRSMLDNFSLYRRPGGEVVARGWGAWSAVERDTHSEAEFLGVFPDRGQAAYRAGRGGTVSEVGVLILHDPERSEP